MVLYKNCRQCSEAVKEIKLLWLTDESLKDAEQQKQVFFKENKVSPNKHMPNYADIRKKLLKTAEQAQCVNLSNGYGVRSIINLFYFIYFC